MKRKLLASAVVFMFAANVMSQTDITPSRYIFATQPVGKYVINEAYGGANPPNNHAPVEANFGTGYVIILNGQFGAGIDAAPNAMYVQSGTSIVDLGNEVGKVLCIKGANSNFSYGTPATGSFNIGWWNIGFFTDKTTTPIITPIRFSVVFKIIENTPDESNGQLSFRAYTAAGDPSPATKVFASGAFVQRYDDGDNEPVVDEDGNYVNDDELWLESQFDFQAGTESGIPMRLQLNFSNQAKLPNSTILIKSIKMIASPVEDCVELQKHRFKLGSGLSINDIVGKSGIQCVTKENSLTLLNLTVGKQVNVYSVSGKLVSSFVAIDNNRTISLEKGLYIVKSGSDVVKVAIQ